MGLTEAAFKIEESAKERREAEVTLKAEKKKFDEKSAERKKKYDELF